MNQESKDNLKNTVPSPVSMATKSKKIGMRIIAIIVAILVIYAIISSGHKTKKQVQQESAPSSSNLNVQAPQLQLNQQQVDKLQTALQQLKNIQPNNIDIQSDDDEQNAKLEKMRMVAPTQVYSADGNVVNVGGISNKVVGDNTNGSVLGDSSNSNSQFMKNLSSNSAPIAYASKIAHPTYTLAQGTMIWATLETRIASDLPGMVRAVTSSDIYSEDGLTILLPRGSKLIGQYSSGISQGQNRIFVVWQRVIRPDHIDIQLNSPGTDQLGTAGVGADSIDYHFFQQFGTSVLLSLIGAGAANVGVTTGDQYNSAAAYREAIANSFSQTAQNTLQSNGSIKPTLYVNQGTKISVFVARDLDFSNELMPKDDNTNF